MSKELAVSDLSPEQLGPPSPLLESARSYAKDSSAKRTRRGYAADWRAFEAWCSQKGLQALPVRQDTLAVYLSALADEGKKLSTVRRACAGVVFTHKESGFDWKASEGLKKVLKGIERTLGVATSHRAPLTPDDMLKMVKCFGESLVDRRDRALLTFGWAGAFRRSELVGFDVEDLTFEPDGLRANLRRSKTDQEGAGRAVGIPYAGDPRLCPVRSMQAWLQAANISKGPVFRRVPPRGSVPFDDRLRDQAVWLVIRRRAEAAGLDPTRFGGHSLRRGFATTAAARGKSIDSIMRTTGHKTAQYLIRDYIQPATIFEDNAATGLL